MLLFRVRRSTLVALVISLLPSPSPWFGRAGGGLSPMTASPSARLCSLTMGTLITRGALAAAVGGAGRASGSGGSGSDGPPGGGDGPRGGPGDLFARWDGGGSRSSPGAVEPPGHRAGRSAPAAGHPCAGGWGPPAAAVEAAQELGLPLLHLDPLASATEPVARLTVPVVADFIWHPTGRCMSCRRWGSTQPPSATGVWRRWRSTTPT